MISTSSITAPVGGTTPVGAAPVVTAPVGGTAPVGAAASVVGTAPVVELVETQSTNLSFQN